ncbi:MAG: DNA-processing protein DprA [Lachnospiraceae bacterium]|nr:DNA-processing protein DprA [Lachnospiraceae bacterium]
MTEKEMLYSLSHLSFLTADKFDRMLEVEGSIAAIYNIEETGLQRVGCFSGEQIRKWKTMQKNWAGFREQYHREEAAGIRFITRWDEDYPEKLRLYSGQPYGIYVRGKLPDPDQLSVAIVGARKCSSYGRALAEKFGRELAEAGVQIISGAAAGIDGISQWAALQAGGASFGVLGSGVDIVYPPENAGLFSALLEKGGLISEYPVGRPPLAIQFPPRNRIISGLADCLVVVEARKKSGTLITTDYALEQGKDIGAVPGRVGDGLSEGCNRLIQSGAFLVQDTEDILNILGKFGEISKKIEKKTRESLASLEKTVYSCLGLVPKHLEQIVLEAGVSLPQAMEALLTLELKGVIVRAGVNEYVKRLT